MKKITYIIISLVLVFTIFIIAALTTGKGSLDVESKIDKAQFMFNNKVYYAPVKISNISPGEYKILVHNTDYQDEEHNIVIKAFSTTRVSLVMIPLTNSEKEIDTEEKKWINYFKEEKEKSKKIIIERKQKYPLSSFLPQYFGDVVFDYESNKDKTIRYVVWALPGKTYNKSDYEVDINNFIRSKGVDPGSIMITWK